MSTTMPDLLTPESGHRGGEAAASIATVGRYNSEALGSDKGTA